MCSPSSQVGKDKLLQPEVTERLLCLTLLVLSYHYGHRRQATAEQVSGRLCAFCLFNEHLMMARELHSQHTAYATKVHPFGRVWHAS